MRGASLPDVSLEGIDIYDPDRWVQGVPHDDFRRLRAEEPVFWQELPGGGGYWALTKHEDVKSASEDPATFSAARRGIILEDPDPETLAGMRTQLLSMDPPEHGRMRRTVHEGLTPGRVGRLEGWIRDETRRVLAAAEEREVCDFVSDVAGALPLAVIAELLGVPEADRSRLLDWGDRIIGRDDAELSSGPEAVQQAVTELGAYGFQLGLERREASGDDLVSVLLSARVDGRPVNEVEFAALFVQIAVAGNETTRSLLSGSLLALQEHPKAWRALQQQPSRLPVAVEEMLRWVTPVHYFRRTATRDTELRGRKIREGDAVALLYASANRDEEVFPDPDRFDIARHPNPHLAFGSGEHFCLGAKLARLEARVFFEELLARFERVEPAGAPRRMRSNLNHSWKSIPVRLVPR